MLLLGFTVKTNTETIKTLFKRSEKGFHDQREGFMQDLRI